MTTTGWIVAILSFAVALVLGFAADRKSVV